jgi:hypothetical protein
MNKTNEHVPQESFYASDNPQNTIEDTVTPPTSPQHPSPPPAPFSAAVLYQQSMRQEIYQLQIQLKELEMIVTEPFVIYITGIQNLNLETGNNWNERIFHLFYVARIPLFWILDLVPDDNEENYLNPDSIKLYVISYQVKIKVTNILNDFLITEYNNIVYIQ